MQAIDFMNDCLYDKEPGSLDNLKSHPKMIIIKKDGTILFSDRTSDDKKFTMFGEEIICNNHMDYMKALAEKYFSHNYKMIEDAKKGNLYGNLLDLIDDGNIVFNNVTTYDGPTFYLHGIHGSLLIPDNYTEQQEYSLTLIDEYINYFKTIEVVEYNIGRYSDENRKEVNMVYYEKGNVAVKNYLSRKSAKSKSKF